MRDPERVEFQKINFDEKISREVRPFQDQEEGDRLCRFHRLPFCAARRMPAVM